MRRFPRSLLFYIAASTIYAAVIFLAVHAVYGVELGRAGVRIPDPGALIGSIEITSFILWLGISVIAGTILHRLATALEGAHAESAVRDAEIGSIFALSQTLSGSLDLGEISREYLRSARRGLDASVTLGLLVHDDLAEAFRLVAEEGPRIGTLLDKVYSVSALPAAMRTRVFDHRQPLVLPDTTGGGEQWRSLVRDLPDAQWIHSFATLPLVSQERLVGAVVAGGEKAGTITADRLQFVLVLGQFVAGAIRTSLSLTEAQSRADHEAVSAVQQSIERLRRGSDYLMVDTPPSFTQQTLAAIDTADGVCVVSEPHLASMKAGRDCLAVLEKLSFPKERTLLVINRTTQTGLETDEVARFFNQRPDIVVPYTPAFDDAADRGRPIVVLHPDNAASKQLRDLAARLTVLAPTVR